MPVKSKNIQSKSNFKLSLPSAILFALVFAGAGYAVRALTHAAPPSTSTASSITLDQTAPYLGGEVTFTTTYPKLKGNITPRVTVWCFQDVNGDGTITTTRTVSNGDYVYAATASTDRAQQLSLTGSEGLILGGNPSNGSIWVQRGGGPATCNAELFYYSYSGKQQVYNYLAETPNWQAAGSAQ